MNPPGNWRQLNIVISCDTFPAHENRAIITTVAAGVEEQSSPALDSRGIGRFSDLRQLPGYDVWHQLPLQSENNIEFVATLAQPNAHPIFKESIGGIPGRTNHAEPAAGSQMAWQSFNDALGQIFAGAARISIDQRV